MQCDSQYITYTKHLKRRKHPPRMHCTCRQGGTSCGVVGRTGSGKSSLMLALFRLIDVTCGRVLLDGIDVAKIGLDALRSQLAIIPQVSCLFRQLEDLCAQCLCMPWSHCCF